MASPTFVLGSYHSKDDRVSEDPRFGGEASQLPVPRSDSELSSLAAQYGALPPSDRSLSWVVADLPPVERLRVKCLRGVLPASPPTGPVHCAAPEAAGLLSLSQGLVLSPCMQSSAFQFIPLGK